MASLVGPSDGGGVAESSVSCASPGPDHFHVYLLRSRKNSRRSFYIGKTTDPKKRIRQHNGEILGGAKQTRKASKRPWEMIVVVEGFPSRTSALQFEWQWQHPKKSKVVRSAVKRASASSKRTGVRRLLHILEAMLTSKLWRQYPLDVRICDAECHEWFKKVAASKLPSYMNVFLSSLSECAVYQQNDSEATKSNADTASSFPGCRLCGAGIEGNFVECYHCTTQSHPRCLMGHFLTAELRATQPDSRFEDAEQDRTSVSANAVAGRHEPLLPAQGPCHYCGGQLTWAAVLRAFYHRHRVRRAAARAAVDAQNRVDAKCGGRWTSGETDALLAGVACHVDGFSGTLSSMDTQSQAEVGQVHRAVWGKILNDSKWFARVLETRTKTQLRHKWEAVVKQAMQASKKQATDTVSTLTASPRARAHTKESVSVCRLEGSLPESGLPSRTNITIRPGATQEQSLFSQSQRRRIHDQVSTSCSGSVVDDTTRAVGCKAPLDLDLNTRHLHRWKNWCMHLSPQVLIRCFWCAALQAKKLQRFESDFDAEDGVFANSPQRNLSSERIDTAQGGGSESDGSIVEILSSNEVAVDSAGTSQASQSSATVASAHFDRAKVQKDSGRRHVAKFASRRRPTPTLSSTDESSDDLDFLV